jgi:hypothetical protein
MPLVSIVNLGSHRPGSAGIATVSVPPDFGAGVGCVCACAGIVVRQVALKQPAINHLESRLCFIVLTNPSLT